MRAQGWVAQGVLAMLVMSCAAPLGPMDGVAPDAGLTAGPKRIIAAVMQEPQALNYTVNITGGSGTDALNELVNSGLVNFDNQGGVRPVLAEAVPTLENGLWKLLPDGRMETTWRLRPDSQWQDGTPLTSADLLFTTRVGQDPELRIRRLPQFDSIGSIEAPDPRTVVIHWKRPQILADIMFSRQMAQPMPRHLLEQAYVENKAAFTELPYWTEGFIGTGPYRVRQWVRDSHLLLDANDRYTLGRPKIDEIEVKFIPDPNALMANILAGQVELTLGRNLGLEQALEVRDQWREGRMEVAFLNWVVAYPQLLTPDPPIVGDVEFRRALVHAVDRQEMADTLQAGLVPVAHTRVNPTQPEYKEIQASIIRYDYDPARARRMIESLGYVKGQDELFRDAGGRPLSVEIRRSAGDTLVEKAALSVGDYWQRVGVGVQPVLVPQQRSQDLEYTETYPGFRVNPQPNSLANLVDFHSTQAPRPENQFRGRNRARYMDPDLDNLLDRYFGTVPASERVQVLAQIERHMTQQVIVTGLFYNVETVLIGNRIRNVTGRTGREDSTQAWNAEQWDTR